MRVRRASFAGVAGLALMTASAGCSSDGGGKAQRQLAITDTEMFLNAGNPRPGAFRISRATPVKAGLWRVEVTAGAGGRRQYSCFTIRLNRFYVHTSATDNVSSQGIETRNRRCP